MTSKAIAAATARADHWPRTIGYYIAFIALGMSAMSLGPTLAGLSEHTNTKLAAISFLFTARAIGYLCGSVISGRVYDRIAAHPVMAGALCVMAVTLATVPTVSQLWMLVAVLFVLGVAEGTTDVGGNAMMVWVHRDGVGPYMNGLHFFFGLGAFIAPLVIAQSISASGDITWAYWSLALLTIPAIIWLARVPSPAPLVDAQTRTAEKPNYRLIALVVMFLFVTVGIEVCFGGWIFTYAYAMHLAAATTAAYLTAVYWGSFTFGRLIGIPLSARFRPRTLLLVDLIGCLISVCVILLWPASEWALWIGVAGAGLSVASAFAVAVTWTGRRMTLTGAATSWFLVGASLSSMTLPWLIGQLFESIGPRATMFTILIDVLVGFVVYTLLMFYGGTPKVQAT
ncbi:MAG: MFS transporter [Chloroflexi bacterium]|nr:MFS transporter [Chloroflexota bacterium]